MQSSATQDGNTVSPGDNGRPFNRRMLVVCPYPQGVAAGQRLKYEQYLDDWRSLGWQVDVSPFMDRALWDVLYERGYLARKAWGVLKGYVRRVRDIIRFCHYDLVFIHMWVTPFGSSIIERLARSLARRIVFDVEDNVLTEQQSQKGNPNPIVRFLKGRGKARFLIINADHVITSSPFLNDYCLALNRNQSSTYISSSVDTDRFRPRSPLQRRDNAVTVGWTGTFSSKPYLDLVAPMLRELAQRVRYKLRVIGNFEYHLPQVDIEVIRWTAEHEVCDLQAIDIGIYPLPINDWVLGKSGLKAIQYMAFGIPPVATDVGTTPMLIRDGFNGLLVRTEDEWLVALERLIRSPELRARLGARARADAVKKYSIQAVADDYRRVLKYAMAGVP